MEETAPMKDAVSNEQGGTPPSMIPENIHHTSFDDIGLPLGEEFERFWADFVYGDLPNKVVERHDRRAKMFRFTYNETSAKNIPMEIVDMRIILVMTFGDHPETWEIEL
jgi:hypothetical protein